MLSDKTRRLGETMLICCIVTALTGVWANGTGEAKNKSYYASKQTQVATIAGALRHYQIDHGQYPPVVNDLIFCQPFDVYDDRRCLGELLGDYIKPDSVAFDQNKYVYMERPGHVFIAADIPAKDGVASTNRCLIKDFEFWCIKLPK